MAEILGGLSKKGKKNLKDLPEGNREYLDEPKYTDDAIKGDPSESGSNSFAKNVKDAVKGLKRDFNNYSKAKNRDEAKVKG